jgi:hypothetical protein
MINSFPSYSWPTVVCAKMKDVGNLNSVSTGLHQIKMLNIVYRFLVLALVGTLPNSSSQTHKTA